MKLDMSKRANTSLIVKRKQEAIWLRKEETINHITEKISIDVFVYILHFYYLPNQSKQKHITMGLVKGLSILWETTALFWK